MKQHGFTLLELMVTVVIIAILAAIAIPSYARYTMRAAQAQVKSDMLAIAGDLEHYRGKNLSYSGYTLPTKYQATNEFYIPDYNDSSNYKYKVTLLDSAVPASGNRVALSSTSAGRGWVMIASPKTTTGTSAIIKNSNYFMLTSTGIRCMTPESTATKTYTITLNATTCEDAKDWQ